ncbi:MAG TPA: VCBS domain-containing protein [Xanthobacteraceae bacterium]|nr:VCBS domain-containing protein [Xanthobacteraceae bacterium]
MDRAIVVAQNGPPGPSITPQVIPVVKPHSNQAITVHLDGATKLDLSAIADAQITLVHVGDRLIILFDNHAQVTIEPFYGDNGQPLPDVTVELGPGRDVSGAAFASLFPVTTDESVLPASGGPGAPSGGASFVSYSIDSLAPTGTPLDLLGSQGGSGDTRETPTNPIGTEIVPFALTSAMITGTVDEGGFGIDTIGTIGTRQGAPVVARGVIGSLDALVDFGSGGPNAHKFQFIAATDAKAWIKGLGLTSQGSLIDTATISGNTLVAGTDPAQGAPHEVFSLTINGDGSWVFTLLAPLDDAAGQGANTATIDLSGLIQAVDAAGLIITFANDFKIVVGDDVPVLAGAAAAGSVEEAALAGMASPGDLFGRGNDPGRANGLAVVSGSLADLVSFGADGPAIASVPSDKGAAHWVADGFQLAVASGAHDFGLTSHGAAVDYLVVTGQPGSEMLTAWTGGGSGHEVFTLQLAGDGSYTFTLINPLDQIGDDTGATTLDLSPLVRGVDFDGDIVALSGDFIITVVNDVPVLTGASASVDVEEAALAASTWSGDQFGSGNDPDHQHGLAFASGSLSGLVSFGADGPLETPGGVEHAFRFAIGDGTSDSTLVPDVTSHGERINFFTVTTADDGSSQTLTAWTTGGPAEGGHEIFTLTLDGEGGYVFTLINPLDDTGANADAITLDLSAFIKAVDFDGDRVALASGDFTVTVADDAPVLTGAATDSVDEGGLSSATDPFALFSPGNDAGAATAASGTLGIHFGADGPAASGAVAFSDLADPANNVTVTDAGGHPVRLDALTSHGSPVAFALIDAQTLVAYTGTTAPAAVKDASVVFSVTLSTAVVGGSYDFLLDQPLDQPLTGEDGLKLAFTFTATDFDGSTAGGTFTVTQVDDVPVLTGSTSSGAVDEGALSTASGDLYGDGNRWAPDHAVLSTGTLAPLVHFGADGPAFDQNGGNSSFRFAVADGSTFDLGVKSHGQEVNFVTLSAVSDGTDGAAQTLTAWTNGGPANDPNSHEVFTLQLTGDGAYVFTLINPIDRTGDAATLDLSGLIKAVDFDGDPVTLSGGFKITVNDDVPAIGAADSGTVLEAGLTAATDPFGSGVHAGSATFATTATGTLGIHFGADGQAASGAATFTDQTNAASNISVTDGNGAAVSLADLTSHGAAVQFALLDAATLVAYTGATAPGTVDDASVVFSVALSTSSANGAYTFVLDQPLDQALTGADALNFAFSYTAQDFDGDTASASFIVTTTDDVPVLTAAASGSVFEAGLTAQIDPFGSGNHAGSASFAAEASGTLGIHFGADGAAASGALAFADQANAANNIAVTDGNGGTVSLADLTSHGAAVQFALLDATTLVAYTGATAPGTVHDASVVFSVALSAGSPNGSYDFVLDQPLDQALAGADALHLTFNYRVEDFDGDAASGSFTVTTTDDVPVLTRNTTSSAVDEGALNTASGDLYGDGNGRAPDHAVLSTGTLAPLVHFGADGPAFDQNGGNSGFHFAVADGSTFDLGVKSHGQEVNFVTLSAVSDGTDGAAQTLTAWTNGGAAGGGHEVFTLTLDGDGHYTFTLINPLDETSGIPFASLDLSRLIEAIDFDGDAVTLASSSFTMGVNDDAPSISGAASASVFEAGLTSATDPFGVGSQVGSASFASEASGSLGIHFGADGPVASGSLHFTDTTTAANNVTVTDGNGAAVSLASLTSHGAAVHFALLDADTLVAYTGPAVPTTTSAASVVFSVTLSGAAANGSYEFVLDKPLDQALAGSDGLNFSFNYTVKDFDGSTAASSFKVAAVDDLPTADVAPAAQVDESGLTSATDPFGGGTDPGAATTASGSFGLHFGADGPAVVVMHTDTFGIDNSIEYHNFNPSVGGGNFRFTNITAYGFDGSDFAHPRGDLAGIAGDTVTITDVAGPFTLDSIELGTVDVNSNTPTSGTVTLIGVDGQGDILASLTLPVDTINTFDPATVFNPAATVFAGVQLASLEIVPSDTSHEVLFNDISATRSTPPPLSFTDMAIAANDIMVTDANGKAVDLASLTSHGEAVKVALLNADTFVAYTGNDATDPAGTVFTLGLSNTATNGLYDFVLDEPLDEPAGTGGALNFAFAYTARDFDGDAASGSFTVTALDDSPVVVPHSDSLGTVQEAALTTFGASTNTTGSLDGLVSFGADGPASTAFRFAPNAASVLELLGLTSHGQTIAYDVTSDSLLAFVGSTPVKQVFSITLSSDGLWDFFLSAPIDHNGSKTIDLSGAVEATDRDGSSITLSPHDFEVTVIDDTPTAHTIDATAINDITASATVTPVSGTDYAFGVDGPAATSPLTFDLNGIRVSGPIGDAFGRPDVFASGSSVTFEPDTTTFQQLSVGESATITVPYTVTDFDGSTATADVIFTVDQVVDSKPELTGGVTSGTINELSDVTNSTAIDTTSGSLTFTDVNHDDTHTVSASYESGSAVWSGGSSASIPTRTLTDLSKALNVLETADSLSGQTGSVTWTASLPDKDLDFLAAGETLSATFNIDVTDNFRSGSGEQVVVTFNGANDAPIITAGTDPRALTEGTAPQPQTTKGSVRFTDPDLNDTHTVSVEPNSNIGSFTAQLTEDTPGRSSGNLDWSYTINPADWAAVTQHLFSETYKIDIDDGHGGVAVDSVTVSLQRQGPAGVALTPSMDALDLSAEFSGGNSAPLGVLGTFAATGDPNTADQFTYSFQGAAPTGLVLVPTNGVLAATGFVSNVDETFAVAASDGIDPPATTTVTWWVGNGINESSPSFAASTSNVLLAYALGEGETITGIGRAGAVNILAGQGGGDNFVLTSASFSSNDVIVGKRDLSDGIVLSDSSGVTVVDSSFAQVSNIGVLSIGGTGANSVTLGADASADVGGAGHRFTVDDSGGSGSLTVDGSAMTADLYVSTGSVTPGKLPAAGEDTLIGGHGNDTFLLAGVQFNAGQTIAGGTGSNTIVLSDPGGPGAETIDADAFMHVSGIDTLELLGDSEHDVSLAFDPSADGTLTVDDSHSTGDLTLNASFLDFGIDLIVIAGRGEKDTLHGGESDDTFVLTQADLPTSAPAVGQPFSVSVDGAAGNNTLEITDISNFFTDQSLIGVALSSIEELKLSGSGDASLAVIPQQVTTVDFSGITGSAFADGSGRHDDLVMIGGPGPDSLIGGAGDDTFEFADAAFHGKGQLIDGGPGNNSLWITDTGDLTVGDADLGDLSGIETLKIASQGTATLTLGFLASAETQRATGTLTLDETADTGLIQLDASKFTANLEVLVGSASQTVTTGSGQDTYAYAISLVPGSFASRLTIDDFKPLDSIQISASAGAGGVTANENVSSIYERSSGTGFMSTSDRFHFDDTTHGLYYSHDGTTASEVLLATVTNGAIGANGIHIV